MKKLINQKWEIKSKNSKETVVVDFDNHGEMGCMVSITKDKKTMHFTQFESLELKEIFESTKYIFRNQLK